MKKDEREVQLEGDDSLPRPHTFLFSRIPWEQIVDYLSNKDKRLQGKTLFHMNFPHIFEYKLVYFKICEITHLLKVQH